ncbi:MAG: hypothetical protein ACI35S_05525 [Anaeroplasma sp.]
MFVENTSKIILISIIGAVCLLFIFALIFVIVLKKRKNGKKIKIDDIFIDNLITLLGGKDNILKVVVDNGRLKFEVKDTDITDLNGLKEISTSGVFVTGNVIKTLFKLDSFTIQKAIQKKL